jgi:hypothetical protein
MYATLFVTNLTDVDILLIFKNLPILTHSDCESVNRIYNENKDLYHFAPYLSRAGFSVRRSSHSINQVVAICSWNQSYTTSH